MLRPTHPDFEISSPTQQAYAELQQAYDHFNDLLFGGQLPPCLITLQREKATFGYFSSNRFTRADGRFTDEIAMNPTYFAAVPLVETFQTLVHEMVHLWQSHFGSPGRGRYHNHEWANKMESIGLMPSATGAPGGKRTGDHMADYALKGGRFLQACAALLTSDFTISWYDRFPAQKQLQIGMSSMAMDLSPEVGGGRLPAQSLPDLAPALAAAQYLSSSHEGDGRKLYVANQQPNKSNRVKYTCPCDQSVWGKPGLSLICGTCTLAFAVC